ncbi:MAG: hypothetical protein K1X57_19595 [Gemmataceae bacterium]|nr:hypothetical protein [Gemmataceae bacterium]
MSLYSVSTVCLKSMIVALFVGTSSASAIEAKFQDGYPKEDPAGSVSVKVDIKLGLGERLKSYTVEIKPIDPADNPTYSNSGDLAEKATSISNSFSPVRRGKYKVIVTIIYLNILGQEVKEKIESEITVNGS